jgi:hypothetical protein
MSPRSLKPCPNQAAREPQEQRNSAAPSVSDFSCFRPGGGISRKNPAAIVLLALATAWPFAARAQKPLPANLTADLPPGPLQAKATSACLECHEARIILQQRLSKAAWTKEVDKMTKWGAVVDSADRDALIDYLSSNFSPDKPPYEPQRTAADGSRKTK